MTEIKHYLWLSQILLFSLLIVCCLIIPSVVIRNGGVSNFGNHLSTIVPYILGFSLSIIFLCIAAYTLLKLNNNLWRMACLLLILGLLNLLVLLSTFPRHSSWTYSDIHDDIGIVLYAYEFLVSVWIVLKIKTSKSLLFILIEAIGSIIGLLSILKIVHFLFIGQFVGALGFGLLLVTIFPVIIETRLAALVSKA